MSASQPTVALAMKNCLKCTEPFQERHKNGLTKYCPKCREKKWLLYTSRNWEISEQGKAYMRQYHAEKKKEYKKIVFDYYGGKCNCCNEATQEFLSIDHVNNNGYEHRKRQISGARLYKLIIAEGFSEDYQILCMNCNFGKKITGVLCPHQM